jgi:hypothetical protein
VIREPALQMLEEIMLERRIGGRISGGDFDKPFDEPPVLGTLMLQLWKSRQDATNIVGVLLAVDFGLNLEHPTELEAHLAQGSHN